MPILPRSKRLAWQAEIKVQGGRLINDSARYKTKEWTAIRDVVRYQEPICRICQREATFYIDHIKPVKQGGAFLDRENLQGLCKHCHNVKSGQERHTNKKQ